MTQQKRKLRIYISNTYTPSKPEGEDSEKVASWELRVEGKLLEEVSEWHLHFKNKFHLHNSTVSEKLVLLCSWPECLAQTSQPDVFMAPFTPPHV